MMMAKDKPKAQKNIFELINDFMGSQNAITADVRAILQNLEGRVRALENAPKPEPYGGPDR